MDKLIPLDEFFNGRIYRIPDFQRGYSWQEKHYQDLWNDILNIIASGKVHYTGAIKLKKVKINTVTEKWEDTAWNIDSLNDRCFYIIDGQQRITTFSIILYVLLESIKKEGDSFCIENDFDVANFLKKYIYSISYNKKNKLYLFGYEKDDPSYNYLKSKIFNSEENEDELDFVETAYTNNLYKAKVFFQEKIKKIKNTKKIELFKIITQKLKFNYIVLDDDLEINVIFETENFRGKPLTYLENLKNRLLYLATYIEKKDIDLSTKISKTWHTIYEYIGLNKKNILNDNIFLKAHWTIFCRYSRDGKDPFARDIFEEVFNIKRVLNKQTYSSNNETVMQIKLPKIQASDVYNYCDSLEQAVKHWYIINNPRHAFEIQKNKRFSESIKIQLEEVIWLDKLNRLGIRGFAPIIMAARLQKTDDNIFLELLKSVEKFNFVLFKLSNRRANTGEFYFQRLAYRLYDKAQRHLTGDILDTKLFFSDLIKDINEKWIERYESSSKFKDRILELYLKPDDNEKKGYKAWDGLIYLLQEYELSLLPELEYLSLDLKKYTHSIFNKNEVSNEKNSHSLGNLFLSSKKTIPTKMIAVDKISKLQESNYLSEQNLAGELENYTTPEELIEKRGLDLLEFIEKRWDFKIPITTKKELLNLSQYSQNYFDIFDVTIDENSDFIENQYIDKIKEISDRY